MTKNNTNHNYVTKKVINAPSFQASKIEQVTMEVCASVKITELDFKQLWRGS